MEGPIRVNESTLEYRKRAAVWIGGDSHHSEIGEKNIRKSTEKNIEREILEEYKARKKRKADATRRI